MASPAGNASGFTVVLGMYSSFSEERFDFSAYSPKADWINSKGAAY